MNDAYRRPGRTFLRDVSWSNAALWVVAVGVFLHLVVALERWGIAALHAHDDVLQPAPSWPAPVGTGPFTVSGDPGAVLTTTQWGLAWQNRTTLQGELGDDWMVMSRFTPSGDITHVDMTYESPPPHATRARGSDYESFMTNVNVVRDKDGDLRLATDVITVSADDPLHPYGFTFANDMLTLPPMGGRTILGRSATPTEIRARVDGKAVVLEGRHPMVHAPYEITLVTDTR